MRFRNLSSFRSRILAAVSVAAMLLAIAVWVDSGQRTDTQAETGFPTCCAGGD